MRLKCALPRSPSTGTPPRRNGSRPRAETATGHFRTHRLLFVCALIILSANVSAVHAANAPTSNETRNEAFAPIKIAVFDFELEDFSAARGTGRGPDERAFLTQATEEAKRRLMQSRRYSVVETSGVNAQVAKAKGLRDCSGCEAAIALKLGAHQSLIGVITKISMMEYTVRLSIRDAGTGASVADYDTDLRMGTNNSWARGVAWLLKNRMLPTQDKP